MLRTRLLVSFVLVPAFIGLCWLDARIGNSAAIIMSLALILAIQSCRELGGLLKLERGSIAAMIAGCLLILLTLWGRHAAFGPETLRPLDALGPTLMAFAVAVLGLLFIRTVVFLHPGGHAQTLGAEVLGLSYIGVLLATVAELRWTGGGGLGYLALGSLVIGAKVGDIGGYTFGRLFGKKKLAPVLSPGKTRAGAVGAVLTAAVATACWLRFTGPLFDADAKVGSWPHLLTFGAVLGVVGLVGDLCESLLKRDAGMKDASHLMPAFGGLLDLIDSILYAGPVALLMWTLWPPVW